MEKIFVYSLYWRYASENFEHGIIKAESKEEAIETLKKANPTIIYEPEVYEPEFDSIDSYIVYSK